MYRRIRNSAVVLLKFVYERTRFSEQEIQPGPAFRFLILYLVGVLYCCCIRRRVIFTPVPRYVNGSGLSPQRDFASCT